jgi:DNA-binding PadR family transcriptional regulator
MSAKHAVLGLIIERPGYGYQLAQRLEDRCGSRAWTRPNVYGTLDRLLQDGHISVVGAHRPRTVEQDGRTAPRPVYAATQEGREFFSAWMSRASAPKHVRDELDLKLLFSSPEFLPDLMDQARAHEQVCLRELAALKRALPTDRSGPTSGWRGAAILLEREREMKMLEARVEWLQHVREAMREIVAGSR